MGLTTSFTEIDKINVRDICQSKYIVKYINDEVDELQDQLLSEALGSLTVAAEVTLIVISDSETRWEQSLLWILFV